MMRMTETQPTKGSPEMVMIRDTRNGPGYEVEILTCQCDGCTQEFPDGQGDECEICGGSFCDNCYSAEASMEHTLCKDCDLDEEEA